jgi:DNA-3-methyladenine glycosylase I
MIRRCPWGDGDPLMIAYHDTEWGVPLHDDQDLFAKLVLDGFQAGLSWRVILHKRARFLELFERFDAERVARYDRRKIAQLLRDPGIIRNRQKVEAALTNARAFLAFRARGDSFAALLWGFVGGTPRQYRRRSLRDLPARSRESDAMSAALLERGFRFVGPTICYAFMQAVGMVNDHLVSCFRHGQVARLAGSARR